MFETPESKKRDAATAEAFANPRVGDRFHEFFSYWVFVIAIEGERIMVMTAPGGCTLPDDGEIKVFETHDAYRQAFAYRSRPGYSVSLAGRDSNVTGWATDFPEVPSDVPTPAKDSTQATAAVDPDVLSVLEYVSRGRGYVGVEPYPDFQARRALGRLHDEGSLRSQASGTPGGTT